MYYKITRYLLLLALVLGSALPAVAKATGWLTGKVTDNTGEAVAFAVIKLIDTDFYTETDIDGAYTLSAPAGQYEASVSASGYSEFQAPVTVKSGSTAVFNAVLQPLVTLKEVVVTGSTLSKVNNSAFNATAVNTQKWVNTGRALSDALATAPGIKVRESGGVGSDMSLSMDGFTGKHVKVFIDGVPQEGDGASFSLNNIPAGYADRIEVYRGVVPVQFGADAIGGVVNIVTPKAQRSWTLDASYSYGSFNTHRTNVRWGQSWKNGFRYNINAFQNYSDNNYTVYAPVEDFNTGAINHRRNERVRRFNDTYHNEAVTASAGVSGKPWADRLTASVTYSRMYKEIQTGVRQKIVFGDKHRRAHAVKPTLEYSKTNAVVRGLDVTANAAYNLDRTTNIDTSSYHYNWRGEKAPLNSPGEQKYSHSRADNRSWTAGTTVTYSPSELHKIALNTVYNGFNRRNYNLLVQPAEPDEIAKQTHKVISGASYTVRPHGAFNASVFGKVYRQHVAGPMATSAAQDRYTRVTRSITHPGYGMAGTWFAPAGLQLKASYEKACRLPSIEEMFGDEDLESGDMALRPETSHNVNLNLSWNWARNKHSVYLEGAAVYRDTRDYIQRNILALSGGKSGATYINYGKVRTTGFTLTGRYNYGSILAVGGGMTAMDVTDRMRTGMGNTMPNLAYGQRMPNQPYLFADGDVTLNWNNAGARDNTLSLMYDTQFTKSFCYYTANIGADQSDYMVPNQWTHNLTLSYAVHNGRYNLSVECRNLTDARLYDNFSLQKAGRAFYAKVRVQLGK